MPIRLFIVDDHHVVRMGLQSMLRREPDINVIGTAASGQEALRALQSTEVDVLLTDLRMQGMNGDEMLLQMRRKNPAIRAVVLTNYQSDEDVSGAIKAGAMAFVSKTATIEEVLDAIRSVAKGGRWIPSHVAQQLVQHMGRDPLSPRELEILRLLARGLRNREIAAMLFISEHTVRNHVISLLEKLGTTHRTEGIAVALHQGLIRLDDLNQDEKVSAK